MCVCGRGAGGGQVTGEWVQQWQEDSDEDGGGGRELGGGVGDVLQFGSTPKCVGLDDRAAAPPKS